MLERACQCVAVVEMVVEMHCSKVSNTSSADDAAAVGAMMNGSVRRMNEKESKNCGVRVCCC